MAWRRHVEGLTTEACEAMFFEEAALCGALDTSLKDKPQEREKVAETLLERLKLHAEERGGGGNDFEQKNSHERIDNAEEASWQQKGAELVFVRRSDDIERHFALEEGLLHSEHARALNEARADFPFCLKEEAAFLQRGEREWPVSRPSQLARAVLDAGGEGLVLQRYKGLGEMNPEQLWETTLNPETRVLVKVDIEHLAKADGLFETLMGEKVEPRRKFIEKNALRAVGIDV